MGVKYLYALLICTPPFSEKGNYVYRNGCDIHFLSNNLYECSTFLDSNFQWAAVDSGQR